MSTDMQMPAIVADFVSLTPTQAKRYNEVKDIIHGIAREDDGLMFIFNSIIETGDMSLNKMQMWCDEIAASEHDGRSLIGITHERPLEIPHFAD